MDNKINDYIKRLRSDMIELFPGAVSVKVFVSHNEVSVTPEYIGQLGEVSMQTIDGQWCTKNGDL